MLLNACYISLAAMLLIDQCFIANPCQLLTKFKLYLPLPAFKPSGLHFIAVNYYSCKPNVAWCILPDGCSVLLHAMYLLLFGKLGLLK